MIAAMAHMYNKTSATLDRGAVVPGMYNKTYGSALANGQHQAGTLGDLMMTTAVYHKISTPEGLTHHDDGNGRVFCITKLLAGSGRLVGRAAVRLARVLLTELA